MKIISMDLRKRIVETYNAGEVTRQKIADRFKFSVHMAKKLSRLEPLRHRCGRKAKFNKSDLEWLNKLLESDRI